MLCQQIHSCNYKEKIILNCGNSVKASCTQKQHYGIQQCSSSFSQVHLNILPFSFSTSPIHTWLVASVYTESWPWPTTDLHCCQQWSLHRAGGGAETPVIGSIGRRGGTSQGVPIPLPLTSWLHQGRIDWDSLVHYISVNCAVSVLVPVLGCNSATVYICSLRALVL